MADKPPSEVERLRNALDQIRALCDKTEYEMRLLGGFFDAVKCADVREILDAADRA